MLNPNNRQWLAIWLTLIAASLVAIEAAQQDDDALRTLWKCVAVAGAAWVWWLRDHSFPRWLSPQTFSVSASTKRIALCVALFVCVLVGIVGYYAATRRDQAKKPVPSISEFLADPANATPPSTK